MKSNTARKANRLKRNKPSILFVDDEQRVLNSMRALFRRDYNLFLTTRGDEALEIIEQNDIDVVVADQRMPIMTGVEILSRVKVSSPNTIRILLTGYSNAAAIEGAINSGEVYKFLNKPCPVEELRGTIREAADIATVTAQKNSANEKQQVATQSFTDSMKDVRVKPSLTERINRIMEAVNTRKKNSEIVGTGQVNSSGESISKKDPDADGNKPLPLVSKPTKTTVADSPANNQDDDHARVDETPKSTDELCIETVQSESSCPITNEITPEEVDITTTRKSSRNTPMHIAARKQEEPVVPKISASPLETKETLKAVNTESGTLLSDGKKSPAVNTESVVPADSQPTDAATTQVQRSNTTSTTRRMSVDDDSVDTKFDATKPETIKLEFDLIGKHDEDESMLAEFAKKALSPQTTDTAVTDATAETGSDNEQCPSTDDSKPTAASYSQLKGVVHTIPPGLNNQINAKISRSIASKPRPVVPATKIPALSPEPFVDKNIDENLYSERVTDKRLYPALTVPGHIANKENAQAAANEKFESVEITLGGNTHEIVDLTHSVEIIMSGNTHRIRGNAEEPLAARTDITLPAGMGGFGKQPNEVTPPAETEIFDETTTVEDDQLLADENRRMRVVGTGKYRISIVVFSSDKAFAKSVGRSLHGFFYTFHATTIEQLTHAIETVDPAVLITDVSSEPDLVQELIARFKQQVPDLVTMVASQHRDADLMIKLINYGQVFRMVDKPMSTTACKMYVREALKRHLQLRKNPELMRQHLDRKIEGESKLPSNINRLISGLKLGRVRRLLGR